MSFKRCEKMAVRILVDIIHLSKWSDENQGERDGGGM